MARQGLLRMLVVAVCLVVPTAPIPAQVAGDAESVVVAPGLRLPGTFTGTLPCADCPGIDVRLDLWPDQVYQLRRTYRERGRVDDAIGRWSAEPDGPTLVLGSVDDGAMRFHVQGNGALRLLDRTGRPIESDLPYALTRSDTFAPFTPETTLRGEVRYMADAALYRDCRTGRTYPVAIADAWIDLERAYLTHAPSPGGPLMATFEGRIAARPPMEGDGTVPTVLVDRFEEVWPGERCADASSAAPRLLGTYWRIVALAGTAIDPFAGGREAAFAVIDGADGPRFTATVGCNRLGGGVTIDGTALTFGRPMSTMMACPPPLDDQERLLADALQAATTWRLDGTRLELRDGQTVLAAFEAAYLP